MRAKVANWEQLLTEKRNEASERIDEVSTGEILEIINREDSLVAAAVRAQLPAIVDAVELVVVSLQHGGRLFYLGAGTSGRLGVLDASECPPTFNTEPDRVQAVIAGGPNAVFSAVEGAEDRADDGAVELRRRGVGENDTVVGIAASGVTPFVTGGLGYARQQGASTIMISCSPAVEQSVAVDVRIAASVGPEVITGSTRMKAGTATKMILNMLSTAVMVRLGKTYGNLMVDLRPRSAKLRDRSLRILQELGGLDRKEAEAHMVRAGKDLKVALVMRACDIDGDEAARRLQQHGGRVKELIRESVRSERAESGKNEISPPG